ncbi:MAG: glycosyltransferase family 2 protein [Verrucomicrobiota bacterium]
MSDSGNHNSRSPKVSILIPTYNYARFLPEALESVLAQEFTDFEVIVLDDRSPDNTAEVMAEFCRRDPRIFFAVNPTNLGMVANWNACLAKARGEYVKYLFGDDALAKPTSLGTLVQLLDTHPAATLATSARKIIDEASRPMTTWDDWRKNGCHDGRAVMFECLRTNQNLLGEPSAVMFRRKFSGRGFDSRYRQIVDLEMWFHLLEQGDLAYTSEALCCFRVHGAQQTAVNRASLIGHKELLMLFSTCADRPWYLASPALTRLNMLRALRKLRNVCPRPEYLVFDRHVRSRIPQPLYGAYWIAHRIYRPFENAFLSLQKRWRRRGGNDVTTAG